MFVNRPDRRGTSVVLISGFDRIGKVIFNVSKALESWAIISRVPVTGASGDKIAPWKCCNSLLDSDRNNCISGIGEYCPNCRIRGQSFVLGLGVEASTPKSLFPPRLSGRPDSKAHPVPCVLSLPIPESLVPTNRPLLLHLSHVSWVSVTKPVRLCDPQNPVSQ